MKLIGSEEKADRELGLFRDLRSQPMNKSSSTSSPDFRVFVLTHSLLTCKTTNLDSNGALKINLNGGQPFVCLRRHL